MKLGLLIILQGQSRILILLNINYLILLNVNY